MSEKTTGSCPVTGCYLTWPHWHESTGSCAAAERALAEGKAGLSQSWEDVYRVQTARIAELEDENARLITERDEANELSLVALQRAEAAEKALAEAREEVKRRVLLVGGGIQTQKPTEAGDAANYIANLEAKNARLRLVEDAAEELDAWRRDAEAYADKLMAAEKALAEERGRAAALRLQLENAENRWVNENADLATRTRERDAWHIRCTAHQEAAEAAEKALAEAKQMAGDPLLQTPTEVLEELRLSLAREAKLVDALGRVAAGVREWNRSVEAIIGRVPDYRWGDLEEAEALLAAARLRSGLYK
jgi:DNA repair exonuclease SbcCD ATPase subunit